MDNKEQIYINHENHLSQHQLMRYNEGEMSDREMHEVEMHLLSCDLCTDAVEGTALIDNDTLAPALEGLKERLSYRIGKRRKREGNPIWRWAAVAAILLLSSFAIMLILNTSKVAENSIVTKETAKETSPEPLNREPFLELETESLPAQEQMAVQEISADKSKGVVQNRSMKEEKTKQTNIKDSLNNTAETLAAVSNFPLDSRIGAPETIAFSDEEVGEKLQELQIDSYRSADNTLKESLSGRTMGVTIAESKNDADKKVLSGKIFDESGEPIPGANIILRGSTKGAISDINGEYSFSLPKSDTALEISFIGYSTEEIFVDDTVTNLSTTLNADLKALSEVVVTGYGTKSKRDVTGTSSVEKPNNSARPIDGRRKFDRYIQQNLSTGEAEKAGVKGDIRVSFLITENGTLDDIHVLDSIGYGLDDKVVQLLIEGPKWQFSTEEKNAFKQAVILRIPIDIKKK